MRRTHLKIEALAVTIASGAAHAADKEGRERVVGMLAGGRITAKAASASSRGGEPGDAIRNGRPAVKTPTPTPWPG